MTQFNPENKKLLTFGEALGPAMKIVDQEDADQYYEAYVNYLMSVSDCTREKAEEVCKANLGYYAGYYDAAVFNRVHKLFKCLHPIFGDSYPTAEEALKKGKEIGEHK